MHETFVPPSPRPAIEAMTSRNVPNGHCVGSPGTTFANVKQDNDAMKTAAVTTLAIVGFIIVAACGRGRGGGSSFAFPAESMHEGDLVFRRGCGITSYAVVRSDPGGRYSHIGIVARDGGEMVVVHSVPGEAGEDGAPDRVKVEAVASFFAPDKAREGALLHFTCDSTVARRAARLALEIAARGVEFDHDYDLGDTCRLYCTELVHHVYSRCGIDVTEGRRTHLALPGFTGDYIMPSDIYESTLFEVKYTFY